MYKKIFAFPNVMKYARIGMLAAGLFVLENVYAAQSTAKAQPVATPETPTVSTLSLQDILVKNDFIKLMGLLTVLAIGLSIEKIIACQGVFKPSVTNFESALRNETLDAVAHDNKNILRDIARKIQDGLTDDSDQEKIAEHVYGSFDTTVSTALNKYMSILTRLEEFFPAIGVCGTMIGIIKLIQSDMSGVVDAGYTTIAGILGAPFMIMFKSAIQGVFIKPLENRILVAIGNGLDYFKTSTEKLRLVNEDIRHILIKMSAANNVDLGDLPSVLVQQPRIRVMDEQYVSAPE